MGWIALAVIGLGTVALLWVCGLPRSLWMFAGAAVMLGATGYALQGSPMLPGNPVTAQTEAREVDQDLLELRHQMFGHIVFSNGFFTASEALARSGETRAAVNVMLGGVRHAPQDAGLWTGLGIAYGEHDEQQLSPAARLAFEHAIKLAPNQPGPAFFYGRALFLGGDFAGAQRYWKRALALSPEDAPYRRALEMRVALLDQLLQEMDSRS